METRLTCPTCGANVRVATGDLRPSIPCRNCGTQVSQAVAPPQPAAARPASPPGNPPQAQSVPLPVGPAGFPPQAQPMPQPPYPGVGQHPNAQPGAYPFSYGPAGYPPPKKSAPRIILLVVLAVGVFAILVVAAIPLIVSKGSGVSATGSWHQHNSLAGGFRAEFPSAPREAARPMATPLGQRTMHRALLVKGMVHFEASYFDLGHGPTHEYYYDYDAAAMAIADMVKGKTVSQTPSYISGLEGTRVLIRLPSGNQSMCGIVRSGNRVHLIACENYPPSEAAMAARFVNSLSLHNPIAP
jgi:hypothetical protein